MADDKEPPWLMYQRMEHDQKQKPQPPQPITDLPGNIVRSAGQFVGQLGDVVKGMVYDDKGNLISLEHPLGATPTGMLNLAMGTANKMLPGRGPMEEYPEAVAAHFAKRYSPENIGATAYQDPVGTAADLSMIAGAGSLATRGASTLAEMANLPRIAGAAARTGDVLNTVSAVTDPIRVGFNVASVPLRSTKIPIISRANPENLYQSALKPRPGSYSRPEVQAMVGTGLKEGIPVSEGGWNKLWGLIDDLNQKVQDRVDVASKAGVTVDPEAVAKRTSQLEPTFREQVAPEADLAAIQSTREEFLRQHQGQAPYTQVLPGIQSPGYFPVGKGTASYPIDMTAREAQNIKTGTYRQLKGKFGELKNAQVETEKALARGIKEELANQIPEIGALNARESDALGLLPELEHALRRGGNHQLFGIGTPIAAGGVYSVTGSPQLAGIAAGVRTLLDNPAIKSQLAIAIYQGMKKNPAKYGPARIATATARANEYIEQLRQQTQAAPVPATP
jgi:hypothetical protein